MTRLRPVGHGPTGLAAGGRLAGPRFLAPPDVEPRRPAPRVRRARPVPIRVATSWAAALAHLNLVLLLDQSGSMFCPAGDPAEVRTAAAISIARVLGRCRGARVGAVHWGTTAPTHLVVPLTDAARRRVIERGLRTPECLGGNDFPAALARARDVLATSGKGRVPVVIGITDGIEEVGATAAAQLAALPAGCVHVLLIDHSQGCSPDLEAAWRRLPLGSFTRLELLDTAAMAHEAAAVIASTLSLPAPVPPTRTSPKERP